MDQFSRSAMILGEENLSKLKKSTVAVFGLGGVGSYVVEALARCGVGGFVLVDDDTVDLTNLNRQIIALHSTLGQAKVDVAKARILDINPNANATTHKTFYTKETSPDIIGGCDYVIDAIDTVASKLSLVETCKQNEIPIISCMGTGNKFDPTMFEVTDIFSTSVCPLCRVMRRELRKIGVDALKVVYSKETPLEPISTPINSSEKRTPGSVSFVPSVAGLIIASEVVKELVSMVRACCQYANLGEDTSLKLNKPRFVARLLQP